MRESKIETAVCQYAEEQGYLVYKFVSPNRRGVPDRMFVHPDGKVFFIEFKAPGEVSEPWQEREQLRLRHHNIKVFVVDDIARGKVCIDSVGF